MPFDRNSKATLGSSDDSENHSNNTPCASLSVDWKHDYLPQHKEFAVFHSCRVTKMIQFMHSIRCTQFS